MHVYFQRERGYRQVYWRKGSPDKKNQSESSGDNVFKLSRCHNYDPSSPDSLSHSRRGSSGGSSISGRRSMISRDYKLSLVTLPTIRTFMNGPNDSM